MFFFVLGLFSPKGSLPFFVIFLRSPPLDPKTRVCFFGSLMVVLTAFFFFPLGSLVGFVFLPPLNSTQAVFVGVFCFLVFGMDGVFSGGAFITENSVA